MESPASWDRLTASISVCGISEPTRCWCFLVLQGLVRAEPQGLLAFLRAIHEVQEQGPITGPSDARRIASHLHDAEVTEPPATQRDPDGRLSAQRLELVRGWRQAPRRAGGPLTRR